MFFCCSLLWFIILIVYVFPEIYLWFVLIFCHKWLYLLCISYFRSREICHNLMGISGAHHSWYGGFAPPCDALMRTLLLSEMQRDRRSAYFFTSFLFCESMGSTSFVWILIKVGVWIFVAGREFGVENLRLTHFSFKQGVG